MQDKVDRFLLRCGQWPGLVGMYGLAHGHSPSYEFVQLATGPSADRLHPASADGRLLRQGGQGAWQGLVAHFEQQLPDHAGERGTGDGRQPEQPKLADIGAAAKQRGAGAAGRVDGGVGDRDRNEVISVSASPMAMGAKPAGAWELVEPRMTSRKKVINTSITKADTRPYLPGLRSP